MVHRAMDSWWRREREGAIDPAGWMCPEGGVAFAASAQRMAEPDWAFGAFTDYGGRKLPAGTRSSWRPTILTCPLSFPVMGDVRRTVARSPSGSDVVAVPDRAVLAVRVST